MLETFTARFKNTAKRRDRTEESLRRKKTAQWEIEDVLYFLELLDLGRYKTKFKENKVDGEVLMELDDNDLAALSVAFVGDLHKLQKEIRLLRQGRSRYSYNSSTYVSFKVHVSGANGVERDFSFCFERIKASNFNMFVELLNGQLKHRQVKRIVYVDPQNDVIRITKDDHLHIILHTLSRGASEIAFSATC